MNQDISINYNKGSCDAILDTAKTIYNEESERFKQIEAKINMAITFAGVFLGVYITYVLGFSPIIKGYGYMVYTYLFKLGIFVILVLSILFFLHSIRVGKYEQVDLSNVVTFDIAQKPEEEVKLLIAGTYNDAVDLNKKRIDSKTDSYKKGLNLMYLGVIVFAIHFIIEGVIQFVGK